ncbi:MAG: acyl carrier protein [Oscillospiraceae bacterium]|nr:acyl carrier protein [Oscillospiraceae bacterium]
MFEKIVNYLSKQLDIPTEEIREDTTFESLGIDSLDIVEMVVDMEDELGVELELNDKISTIGELAEFIESKV